MTDINTALRNLQADSAATSLAAATLTLYAGTPPATANDPLSGNNALVSHDIVGWVAATGGSSVANTIADEVITGAGTQTVTFARLVQAGATAQLSVGTGAQDIIVSSTDYTNGGLSKINSLSITQPAS